MLDVPYVAGLIRYVLTGTPFPQIDLAVPLLLGTAATESGLVHTRQLGGGPARGYFQVEPTTERDVWANYLRYKPELRAVFAARCGVEEANVSALQHNIAYGILLTRVIYLRAPAVLPEAENIVGQSRYWKKYYNTALGKGTPAKYQADWERLVAPHLS